ncbi:MAG: hypothetical protein ACOC4L_02280, partial [Halanaerobium sp.]
MSDTEILSVPEKYIRVLKKEEREVLNGKAQNGRKLAQGTSVLFNPVQPEAIKEDNRENRRKFIEKNFTWTEQAQKKILFQKISPDVKKKIRQIKSRKDEFYQSIDINMEDAIGSILPHFRAPLWSYLTSLTLQPKIKKIKKSNDLAKNIFPEIKKDSNSWHDRFEDILHKINQIKIISLYSRFKRIDVVVAFITQFNISDEGISFSSINEELLEKIWDIYNTWKNKNDKKDTACFLSLGSITNSEEKPNLRPANYNNKWINIILYNLVSEKWDINTPDYYGHREAVLEFSDRLKIETFEERRTKIRQKVK